METEQSARHAGVVDPCCPLGPDRFHPVTEEGRRPLDHRSITILASWPYAYFVMMPVNIWLFAIPFGKPVSPIRKLMQDWGLLEWGHALIGLAACCAFAWPLEMPP